MRVLLISLFHPEIVRGGAQQVAYELFDGLKHVPGVTPYLLAAIDPSHAAYYKPGACITGFDGRAGEFLFLSRGYDYWWHKTSDPRLLEAYAAFLRDLQPDVVHFHHFLLLGLDLLTFTRTVLPAVRIMFTLHEFLAICHANGQMLRPHDGALCARASPTRCHQCFPEVSPEAFFLRDLWVKRHFGVVDLFTTPSRFMIEHYVAWGLERARVAHVTNGQRDYAAGSQSPAVAGRAAPRSSVIWSPPQDQVRHGISEQRDYVPRVGAASPGRGATRFGFFGQMVDHKGVWLILKAVAQLRAEGFEGFSVEMNGDNLVYASAARRAEIEAFREAEAALPPGAQRVRFNGHYAAEQIGARMSRVDWCIVPSVWWETFALVISEAWMFGKPVIASDIGAMRERVSEAAGGLLFAAGDASALATVMRRAASEVGLWENVVKGIEPPPSQATMVGAMMDCYRLSNQQHIGVVDWPTRPLSG